MVGRKLRPCKVEHLTPARQNRISKHFQLSASSFDTPAYLLAHTRFCCAAHSWPTALIQASRLASSPGGMGLGAGSAQWVRGETEYPREEGWWWAEQGLLRQQAGL